SGDADSPWSRGSFGGKWAAERRNWTIPPGFGRQPPEALAGSDYIRTLAAYGATARQARQPQLRSSAPMASNSPVSGFTVGKLPVSSSWATPASTCSVVGG